MRRTPRALMIALTVVLGLSGASAPTREESNRLLTAVSKRPSYVFASTPDGLFRASLETKLWERLKTPPEMPLNGTFAAEPESSRLVLYVALRSQRDKPPRAGTHHGLYLSRDDGATWELVAARNDFGATLLHPTGTLFAVTGDDEVNHGEHLLRSPDLGKTWRDITGKASGQFMGLEPDPDHPGLVRIQAWALRSYLLVADDENYQWRVVHGPRPADGRRPSHKFFSRDSFTTNNFYEYRATLSNYFQYDFANQTSVQALEIVPLKTRFEFAPGDRIVVPVRVVLHYDPNAELPFWRERDEKGRPNPKPDPPTIKFADQPGGTDFWGLRVESSDDEQVEKSPSGRRTITISVTTTPDGKTVSTRSQPAAVKYEVANLSPSSPYAREVELSRFFAFSKPGEYRVQIVYDSGGHPDGAEDVWDGGFTSPVFTVVIRM
ncbi:MAG: hypothetical protein P4L84_05320 [Isosphaeraceae bacterium]|nr:hypothetical protein [Isosphaeraceae bacterium]